MSVEAIGIKQEINRLRKELHSEKRLNAEGYFQVSEKELTEYFLKCLRLFRDLNEKYPDELLNNSKIAENVFRFERIKSSFLFKGIARAARNHETGDWNSLKSPYKLFPIIFSDCRLDECILEESAKAHLFASFQLENNSSVGRAKFSSDFFEMRCIGKISVRNCLIENISFSMIGSSAFRIPISFYDCIFKYGFFANAAHFSAPLTMKGCSFNQDDQSNPSAKVIFNNAEFSTSTEFSECNFYTSPKFHEAKMHSDTSFHLTNFHDVSSDAAEGDYRALKQLMHGTGAENEALKFHALEMESRKNTVLPKITQVFHREFPASLSSHFLKIFNDYGRNYFLPWYWLLWFTGVFFVLYSALGVFDMGVSCNLKKFGDAELWLQSYCQAEMLNDPFAFLMRNFVYASHRAFGPLGLVLDSGLLSANSGWVKFLSFTQVIFSSIIWYLIIIQLRRQFKL